MKNLHRSLSMAIVLALCSLQLAAQDPITTIDGVFIEHGGSRSTEATVIQFNTAPIVDGDVIVFDIPGIGDFLGENPENINDVILVLENIPMAEMPAFIEDSESSLVKFRFQDHQLTPEHRQQLYDLGEVEDKELQLGVKIGKNITINYSPKASFYFEKVQSWRTKRWILIVVFVFMFTLLVLKFPEMIKNDVPNPEGGSPLKGAYSFGRSQLAYWSLIIFSSFIYIYAFTDDINSMNTTALILLGISAATVGGSTILGGEKASEKDKKASEASRARKEGKKTGTAPAGAKSERKTENMVKTEITEKVEITGNAQIVQKIETTEETETTERNVTPPVKKGEEPKKPNFFRDILSDNGGLSINRFQAFTLNVIFGFVFLKTVFADYSMPTFDETQLLLLGVSNSTYVFLKREENKKPDEK